MKSFNIMAVLMFTLLAIVTFVAGFYNHFHFVVSGACFALALIAFFDSSDGKSLYKMLKEKGGSSNLPPQS